MKYFLLSYTGFTKKQYKILHYEEINCLVQKFNYILNHIPQCVIWPVFSKSDKEELIDMNANLSVILKDISEFSDECKIRYNGIVYEVYEITLSNMIKNYWKVTTEKGTYLLDPNYIDFIGNQRP